MQNYELLEKEFAAYIGTRYAVAVNTGTAALHLSLAAMGIGVGDEVLVPEFTFISTAWAVSYTGATPIFYNGFADLNAKITERTKAIIPVHIYGTPVNMELVMMLARAFNLRVIEDCCEAHGAEWKQQKVGSFGDVGCFSFQSSKIVNSEEGGIITTNNKELADKMRHMRTTANDGKYNHSCLAFNYRMPNTIAGLALKSFREIQKNLKRRKEIWELYNKKLKEWGIPWQEGQVAWVYPLRVNVPFGREFFKNMSAQPMYAGQPNAGPPGVVLPINPKMKDREVIELSEKIINHIKK